MHTDPLSVSYNPPHAPPNTALLSLTPTKLFFKPSSYLLISNHAFQKPFAFNYVPVLQFVIFSVLNTPLNCAWQDWLETKFPSNEPVIEQNAVTEKQSEKSGSAEPKQKLSVKNTVYKFALDQVFGALFNTIAFTGGVPAIQGKSWDEIKRSVIEVSNKLIFTVDGI